MEEINLSLLIRALAVAETGSVADAARKLGISRQSVHRSIDALEARLGASVFDRGARQLKPTALGRQILRHAVELRVVERSFMATLAKVSAQPTGEISISTPPLFGRYVVEDAVLRFLVKWPEVRVHLQTEVRRTDLVRDNYDLMIRIGSAPPQDHYARLLGHASLVLCAAPDFIDRSAPILTVGDLGAVRCLDYGPRRSPQWGFSADGVQFNVNANAVLVADSESLLISACLAGLGVLRVPEIAVREHVASGRLVRVLPHLGLPLAEVWAIYGHRTAEDRTLGALLDEVVHVFEAVESR